MAYGRTFKGRKSFGRRRYGMRRGYGRGNNGLHGQIRHRPSTRGRFAGYRAKSVYRRSIRMPKRTLARTYANTVGQIAYREFPRRRPMHGGFGRSRGRGFGRRSLGRRRFSRRRMF